MRRDRGHSSAGASTWPPHSPLLAPQLALSRSLFLRSAVSAPSFVRQFLLDLLDAPKPGVESVRGEKGGVSSLLDDTSLVEDDDAVGLLRHTQAVGHHQRSPPRHGGPERAKDLRLLAGVHRREEVV